MPLRPRNEGVLESKDGPGSNERDSKRRVEDAFGRGALVDLTCIERKEGVAKSREEPRPEGLCAVRVLVPSEDSKTPGVLSVPSSIVVFLSFQYVLCRNRAKSRLAFVASAAASGWNLGGLFSVLSKL